MMDGKGLCGLLGKNGNQMLQHTGHEASWVNTKLKEGYDMFFTISLFEKEK